MQGYSSLCEVMVFISMSSGWYCEVRLCEFFRCVRCKIMQGYSYGFISMRSLQHYASLWQAYGYEYKVMVMGDHSVVIELVQGYSR
jgi:hypothetical protein